MPVSPGTRLGAYEILSLLGAGGMGEVFVARDPRLGRQVAVKVLPDEVVEDADRLRRFEREARAAAALNHPNVVVVHELSREGDVPFVVMELLDGETLRQRLDRGPLPPAEALECATQVARGLAAAHSRGIVHRDLKPENLFLTVDGVVKVLDFGLARLEEGALLAEADGSEVRTGTAPGAILGTLGYLSPEQVRGHEADARSDLFALGAVLHELLSGKRAFSGPTPADTLSAILHGEPRPVATATAPLPAALDRIARRCLEKRPEDRFHSAHDLALALEAAREAPTPAPGVVPAEEAEERSPYPGLRFFTEEDAVRFFGREEEIETLWACLKTRTLLAVIGPSGAGKSSLVRAGVVASRPTGWATLVCTPGTQAFRGLGEALAPELAGDPDSLRKLLEFEEAAFELVTRWRGRHGEALLVVDQLEELFTLNAPQVQERFADLLGRLASEGDVHVLLSLRDDFLMRCSEHPSLAKVFTDLTPLPPLGGDALRRAVEEPARREGFALDEGLVDEMLQAVEGSRGALPLLAFAVSRLWAKRDRERKLLTRAAYEEIGGVAGALAQHAEQTLDRIGPERQPVVREMFRNLVTAQGTRASSEREELLSIFPEREATAEVLQELIAARLLTSYEVPVSHPEGADAEQRPKDLRSERVPLHRHRIEVVHESLLKAWPRLVWWQAQDEEGAQLRDQLKQAAHLWEEKGRSSDVLWTGRAFREFELWRERYPGKLTALEEQFARAMVQRDRRRRNLLRGAVAAGFVLLAAVAVAIGLSRQQALEEARRAEASKLLAVAQLALDDDPTEALAYATASLELADTPEARVFAVRALAEGPPARELDAEGVSARAPRFSPEGTWLAAAGHGEEAGVWSDEGIGPLRLGGLNPSATCENLALWPSERWLVTGPGCAPGDRVHLWSLPVGERLRTVEFEPGSEWSVGVERLFVATRDDADHALVFRTWRLPDGEPEILARVDTTGLGDRFPFLFEPDGEGWLYAKGRDIFRRPLPDDGSARSVLFDRHPTEGVRFHRRSCRGRRVVTVDRSGEIHFRPDPRSPAVVMQPAFEEALEDLDPSGRWIVEDLWAGDEARVWDLGAWADARPLRLRRNASWRAAGSDTDPTGRWLVASTHNWERLTFWPLPETHPVVIDTPGGVVAPALAFSPDGSRLAVAWPNATVELRPLMNSDSGETRVIELPEDVALGSLAFAPNGRFLFGAGVVGRAYLIPLNGSPPRRLSGFSDDTRPCGPAVSPSGRLVAAAPQYGPGAKDLKVWDVETGRETSFPLPVPADDPAEGTGFEGGVNALHFLDESTLVTAGHGGLRRWDLETGEQDLILPAEGGSHVGMVASTDGTTATVLSFTPMGPGGGSVQQVNLHTGESRPPTPPPPTALTNFGMAAAYDAKGVVHAAGHVDGLVSVALTEDFWSRHLLAGHEGNVSGIAVSPDGRWVASVGEDRTLRLWRVPDLAKPPLHSLSHEELVARLRSLTNLRAVRDEASPTRWSIALDPFPGWRDAPAW